MGGRGREVREGGAGLEWGGVSGWWGREVREGGAELVGGGAERLERAG